jgi:hypothetical protein
MEGHSSYWCYNKTIKIILCHYASTLSAKNGDANNLETEVWLMINRLPFFDVILINFRMANVCSRKL